MERCQGGGARGSVAAALGASFPSALPGGRLVSYSREEQVEMVRSANTLRCGSLDSYTEYEDVGI